MDIEVSNNQEENMKKVFSLKVDNKTPERQADSIKHEVKKYITRERKKKTKDGVDFWDFDCKMGLNSEESSLIHVKEINKKISSYVLESVDSCYLEIMAKPGYKSSDKKEKKEQTEK